MAEGAKPKPEEWVDPYRKKRSFPFLKVVGVLLFLYLLGIGPLAMLEADGKISRETLNTTYLPLVRWSEASPSVKAGIDWYKNLWKGCDCGK